MKKVQVVNVTLLPEKGSMLYTAGAYTLVVAKYSQAAIYQGCHTSHSTGRAFPIHERAHGRLVLNPVWCGESHCAFISPPLHSLSSSMISSISRLTIHIITIIMCLIIVHQCRIIYGNPIKFPPPSNAWKAFGPVNFAGPSTISHEARPAIKVSTEKQPGITYKIDVFSLSPGKSWK